MSLIDFNGFDDLGDKDLSESLSFDLYEDLNHEATQQSGSLKSYEVKQHGGAIYDSKESGHRVTVERLLWVDGWENPIEKAKGEQEMTLIVLKIVLAPQNPTKKFRYMKATLIFEDTEKNGENDIQVQAWAPFNQIERWNKTVAQHTRSSKKEGSVEVGYSVASATGSWSSEGEVSWDQTAFDEGRSNSTINEKTGNRNGVTWVVNQNKLENAGVTQELWVAVLLSRPTRKPYLAKFEISTRVGTAEDFKNKTMAFFGLDPGRTEPLRITPWSNTICYFEGKDIIKCVDINNLGALRCADKNSRLNMKWGPNYQVEATMLERSSGSWATKGLSNDSQSKTPPVSSEATSAQQSTAPAAADTIQPLPQLNLPPLVVGWYSPGSMANIDSTRLTGLEERMARLEARLHEQDSKIIALQQKLLEKERS